MKLTLGAFIAQLRKEKGFTQKQLSEILGVSDKTVSHWEREESSPDISLLPLLANTLGVTVDELLAGEKKEPTYTEEIIPEKTEEMKMSCQAPEEENSEDTALFHTTDTLYQKFKTKNYISIALSLIALLCGEIANYYVTLRLAFLIFLTLLVIPVLLTAFFRSSFLSQLSSVCTIDKLSEKYTYKTNRISANCFYFSFSCLLFFGIQILTVQIPELTAQFLNLCLGIGVMILCELGLRKFGFIKKSEKTEKAKKELALKIISAAVAVFLIVVGYENQQTISKSRFVHKFSQYTEFSDPDDFKAFIEKDVPAPEMRYSNSEYTRFDKGTEYSFNFDYNVDGRIFEAYIEFTYNNLQVAEIRTEGKNFLVYTHENLIEAEKSAEKYVNILHALHLAYYVLAVAVTFFIYKFIKKKFIYKSTNQQE